MGEIHQALALNHTERVGTERNPRAVAVAVTVENVPC